ncbi:MAG: hypothetical protein RXQ99_10145 [Acidianus sp.]|uniref:hypothetical protein n=1 Tax=Acidianus sp. TaxID=1872104 RepID=UPI00397CEE53
MLVGSSIPNEKIIPVADAADFAIELPSFYVLVTAHGSLYDIYNKTGDEHLRGDIEEWNRKYGAQFLKELYELDKLFDKLFDRLSIALIALEQFKDRLEYFKQTGKVLP